MCCSFLLRLSAKKPLLLYDCMNQVAAEIFLVFAPEPSHTCASHSSLEPIGRKGKMHRPVYTIQQHAGRPVHDYSGQTMLDLHTLLS